MPGELHEGPGWPRGGFRGIAWRAESRGFSLAFIIVFTFSMHLALWLMDLELGGAHGGPGDGAWLFYCSFIVFFDARQGAAVRWHEIEKALPAAPGEG